MKSIEVDLQQHTSNPYYLDVIARFPELAMLKVAISREIAETENSNKFSINKGTLSKMINLYYAIKPDLKERYFQPTGKYYFLDKIVSDLVNSVDLENNSKP